MRLLLLRLLNKPSAGQRADCRPKRIEDMCPPPGKRQVRAEEQPRRKLGVRTCEEELARLRHELQVDDLADLDGSRRGDDAEQRQRGEKEPRHDSFHC